MQNIKYITKNNINQLPITSGVYCFFNKQAVIYIGKAINLKERVKNHFSQPTYKDNFFIEKTEKIGFIKTASEIEALILEAGLIKKYQPRFNSVWRDDKNYFYVAISKNEKPVVFITHQKNNSNTVYLGPFVEGNALKKTLKYLRRAFPYYTSARHPKNQCTWCHLGLCPGPHPDAGEYNKNIKKLMLVLEGKRNNVLNLLKKEMQQLAHGRQFEKAGKVRDQMLALESVMSHIKIIERTEINNEWEKTESIIQGILNLKNSISRMECYDISNIQGKQAVGSMVVFLNGKPDKSQYRKFRIKIKNEPNDIAMLGEILQRRFNNPQWPYPQVILIDGGIAQLNIAIKVKTQKAKGKNTIQKSKVSDIKVISIAKGKKELFIEDKKEPIALKKLPQEMYNLVKHLDDEAHRFAITYHKKLRKKALGLDNIL